MPAVRTPEASQDTCLGAPCNSAFPIERQGRLLQPRSISGLFLRSLFVPACSLPVYASQGPLPATTQDSVRSCWLSFTTAAISGGCISCACKAQPPQIRTCAI